MATPAQIEANRRNAQHSTGPRTPEGKAQSSRNATKLGLFSRHLLLPGENEEELEALREGIYARLRPADELETMYVERFIAASWRLQRALGGENELYARWRRQERFFNNAEVLAESQAAQEIDQMQKHIASLERSMDKALAQVMRLQKLRQEANENVNDENEPNLAPPGDEATGEWAGSSRIVIVKTKPVQAEGEATEGNETANCENEPNLASGLSFPAPDAGST